VKMTASENSLFFIKTIKIKIYIKWIDHFMGLTFLDFAIFYLLLLLLFYLLF
jgi:hypothetical protein